MKLNPLQIELHYQELKNQLTETHSVRFRYRLFRDFVVNLNGNYSAYESYLAELIGELPLFSGPLTWSGLHPSELEELLDIFMAIETSLDKAASGNHLNTIIRRLRQVCILMFACLHEWRSVDGHLKRLIQSDSVGAELFRQKKDSDKTGIWFLCNFLDQYITTAEGRNNPRISFLKELTQDCRDMLKGGDGTILVPVVERYALEEAGQINYGRLRRLSIEAVTPRKHYDDLTWDFRIYGAEYVKNEHFSEPLVAARKLVSENTSKLENSFYKGILRYKLTAAAHHGSSANLAVSALWYTQLQKKADLREQFILNSSAAITGNITPDGHVQPVAADSIEPKVQGAFFSWCTSLVVPYKQFQEFEKKRNKLNEKYPGRNLELIPVKYLGDIFYDRRVAMLKRAGRLAYTAKRIWQKRYSLASVITIIVLSAIIFGLVYGPIDKNPTGFHFEGEFLVLTNSNKYEVKRILVDRVTSDYQNEGGNLTSRPLALLHDITGDGINDVIWATRGSSESQNTSKIQAYSLAGDSTMWTVNVMQNKEFSRQSAFLESGLRTNEIGIVELADDDIRLVTSNDSGSYFPASVLTFNIRTGEVLSEYIHIGHLRDMLLADLTGNGTEEIILTGVNNAYWDASVVVLDPANADGHSPLTTDYKPDDTEPANELFYILIPKSVIGNFVSPVEKYNLGYGVQHDIHNERLLVKLSEGRRVFRGHEENVDIRIYFDREMRPAGVGSTDAYDIIAKELYDEGEISQMADFDYFEAYQDSILYWTGEEFVNTTEFFN